MSELLFNFSKLVNKHTKELSRQQVADAHNKCISVLAKMKVNGKITAEQYDNACNDILTQKKEVK